MPSINAAWHSAHVLGQRATLTERIAWHRAHQQHCACRPVPASLAQHFAAASAPEQRPARTGATKKRSRPGKR